jgi:hypothetical protein
MANPEMMQSMMGEMMKDKTMDDANDGKEDDEEECMQSSMKMMDSKEKGYDGTTKNWISGINLKSEKFPLFVINYVKLI